MCQCSGCFLSPAEVGEAGSCSQCYTDHGIASERQCRQRSPSYREALDSVGRGAVSFQEGFKDPFTTGFPRRIFVFWSGWYPTRIVDSKSERWFHQHGSSQRSTRLNMIQVSVLGKAAKVMRSSRTVFEPSTFTVDPGSRSLAVSGLRAA